ncbi:enoyl-CoA hydratase/isomerase family protein [Halomarina oriensis]|uniref:Enoyl-CoA hydratase/isomerase family protein n=1 Tax=Halomarina oriensis TaxID=671145 RepID=A0A6B0GV68_9EURY|nr:enoyl-CoA hydratase-related protein [Halomarina oriensis]MWG35628.1 enoyl-CoA hydratase/isomerase family protein [Halomarina oriensis]
MADDDYENLELTVAEGVAHLTLASTSNFNSLNPTMADELVDATTRLADDESVRCITLRGTDGVFCAGADLALFDGDERDASNLRSLASTLHDSVLALHQAPKPVVVGVNGVAAGAGFSMALAGDAVVMADDARLEFAYGRIGLTGDGGSTFWLPRLVGLRRAKELILMDEPIDADYAVSLGLVTESVPSEEFDDRLAAMADRLASGPTKAFGATKRLLVESYGRDLPGQMAAETDTIASATQTEDYERGYAAFFGKEDAEFVGR